MKKVTGLTKLLRRNEGISLIAMIAVIVIVSVVAGVFGSIMGRWALSAPHGINSLKAFYLAETALMYAIRDAKSRFYGGSFQYGTKTLPRKIVDNAAEEASYWFELPPDEDGDILDDTVEGTEDDVVNDDDDDSYTGADDEYDTDGDGRSNVYTVIATGKVKRGGATAATRQIKVKATIDNTTTSVDSGIYTGTIEGEFAAGIKVFKEGFDDVTFNINETYPPPSGHIDGVVYQDSPPPELDEEVFKALAKEQGHYHSVDFNTPDGYPNNSFYLNGISGVPNITYVDGDLVIGIQQTVKGIFWVTGDVTLVYNASVEGLIIATGDITIQIIPDGDEFEDNDLTSVNGGLIQYDSHSLTGQSIGSVDGYVKIRVNEEFFGALNSIIANIDIISWQEAVSKN